MTDTIAAKEETGTSRAKTRVKGFKDTEMDFQLMRSLSASYYGGGTAGEVLSTSAKIKDGDSKSWAKEFGELSERVEAEGELRLKKGHKFTARDQFLRACSYYRAAEYFAAEENPMKIRWGIKSKDCFIKYIQLTGVYFEVFDISFEGMLIPSYFLAPDNSGRKRKTLIIISGFDGTEEESYLQGGKPALERDYNVFLIEGPGQAGIRRIHPESTFRPDYEVPIGAAIDQILKKPGVDPDRLVLYGISFGGYFSARAAASDHRIKAVILNSPIIDLRKYLLGFLPPGSFEQIADFTMDNILNIPDENMSPSLKSNSCNLMIRFGKNTMGETFEYLKQFNVGEELKNVKCPSLAMVGEGEGEEPRRQAREYCRSVSGPATEYIFTVEQGADAHCQLGNAPLSCGVLLDWIDEQFE